MSLNATSASCSDKLRTADQHDAWRVRISDKCWAKTGKDILAVTNAACKAALTKLHDEAKTADERAAHSWVSTCWLMITKSLHDDILMKVAHVERGCIETLLKEIAASLVVSTLDEVGPLRLELYGATMQKDCNSDLQTYIAFLQLRQRKLTFLRKPVDEDELVNIFIQGLHPVFQPLKVHLAIVGIKKWDEAVEIVRRFASSPAMVVELTKLKSAGLSQHMFPLTTNAAPPVVMHTAAAPQAAMSRPSGRSAAPCHQFARGRCNSGANCRFSHTAVPNNGNNGGNSNGNNGNNGNRNGNVRCAFCFARGHVAAECRKRLSQLAAVPGAANQSSALVASTTSSSSNVPGNDLSLLDPSMFRREGLRGHSAMRSARDCRERVHRDQDGHCHRQCR